MSSETGVGGSEFRSNSIFSGISSDEEGIAGRREKIEKEVAVRFGGRREIRIKENTMMPGRAPFLVTAY